MEIYRPGMGRFSSQTIKKDSDGKDERDGGDSKKVASEERGGGRGGGRGGRGGGGRGKSYGRSRAADKDKREEVKDSKLLVVPPE